MIEPHYRINLFWCAEDACWVAEVPDLKPFSAHGQTRAQALANIDDAIEGWLEVAHERGYPIPPCVTNRLSTRRANTRSLSR